MQIYAESDNCSIHGVAQKQRASAAHNPHQPLQTVLSKQSTQAIHTWLQTVCRASVTTTSSTELVSAFLRTKPSASPPNAEQAQQLQKDKLLQYNNTLHMTQATHNRAAAAFGMQTSPSVCGEAPHDVHIHRLAGV